MLKRCLMINLALFRKNKSLFKYLMVGTICMIIDYLITLLILEFSKNLFLANAIGYTIGSVSSYVGHTKFTFRKTSRHLFSYKQIIFYSLACISGIITGYLIIKLLISLEIDIIFAKLIQLFIVAFVQFLINSKFTFTRKIK